MKELRRESRGNRWTLKRETERGTKLIIYIYFSYSTLFISRKGGKFEGATDGGREGDGKETDGKGTKLKYLQTESFANA